MHWVHRDAIWQCYALLCELWYYHTYEGNISVVHEHLVGEDPGVDDDGMDEIGAVGDASQRNPEAPLQENSDRTWGGGGAHDTMTSLLPIINAISLLSGWRCYRIIVIIIIIVYIAIITLHSA